MFSLKSVWMSRRASYKMFVYIASSSRISYKKHIKEQCQNVRAYDDILVQDMSREVRVNCGKKKKKTTLLTELLQLGLMDEHFIIHSAAPNRKRRRVTLETYFFSSRLLRLRSRDIIGCILLLLFAYRTLPRSLIPFPTLLILSI
jgi:hypothetical protein